MIRDFLRRFMSGRYGPDQFSAALIAFSLILSIFARLIRFEPFVYVSYLPLVYSLFRLLSRDFASRRRENDRFLRYWSPVKVGAKRRVTALREIRTHKYFKCPACKKTLRVPRGKGRLQITCPKCGERFIKNSGK